MSELAQWLDLSIPQLFTPPKSDRVMARRAITRSGAARAHPTPTYEHEIFRSMGGRTQRARRPPERHHRLLEGRRQMHRTGIGTDCENQPEAHYLLQAFRALSRIAAPALLLKAEAIVPPPQLVPYLGKSSIF